MDHKVIPFVACPRKGPISVLAPCDRRWLFDVIGWRATLVSNGEEFIIGRAHTKKVLTALLTEFGEVELYREYDPEESCGPSCQRARNPECSCSCGGESHGTRAASPFADSSPLERIGDGIGSWSSVRLTRQGLTAPS